MNKNPLREALEAFETAYNAGCGSIARGELGQAGILLKRANGTSTASFVNTSAHINFVDLCMSLHDLSDVEKQAEVLPIRVQQLYVSTLLGKTDEAGKLASEIPVQEYSPREITYLAAKLTWETEYPIFRLSSSLRTISSPQHRPLQIHISTEGSSM